MFFLFSALLMVSSVDDALTPVDPSATLTDIHDWQSFGVWAAGALTGFVAHESGHLLMNLAYRNTPEFIALKGFGFIPFFAISPQISCYSGHCYHDDGTPFGGGAPGMYTISSAGFDVQHISSEVMLTLTPNLRYQVAPYRKGWLTFNVLVSAGYALTAVLGAENGFGDVGGSANAAQIPRDVYAALIMLPALLDTYRYLQPDSIWAPWASRTSKAAIIGVAFFI